MKKLFVLTFLIVSLFSLYACIKSDITKIVVTPPNKTVYFQGESFSDTGMVVIAYKNDNTTYTVDKNEYRVSGFNSSEIGSVTITITYKDSKATFKISIVSGTRNKIDIYYLNDLHGAILEENGGLGLAKIGNFLKKRRAENPYTMILAGGDMLQGSALSNYYNGESTINIMNEIGFDAMVIGNHEFDWGLDVITKYFDNNIENGEAIFPLLGANVFKKGTKSRADYLNAVETYEFGDTKIGIVGTIGYGLESSIATPRVANYEFGIPQIEIEKNASELKNNGCDYVFSLSHDSGNYTNDIVSTYENVDLLFNGHSHQEYVENYNGKYVIQSGSSGNYIGHIELDTTNNNFTASNISYHSDLENDDPTISKIIAEYKNETDEIFNTPIISSGNYGLSRSELTLYLSKLMATYANADFGYHNYGGTRAEISPGVMITYSMIYQVFPFDNVIKTVNLMGSVIKQIYEQNYDFMYCKYNYNQIEDGKMYKIATNDYVFDAVGSVYLEGYQPQNLGVILRDLFRDEMIAQKNAGFSVFNINTVLTGVR